MAMTLSYNQGPRLRITKTTHAASTKQAAPNPASKSVIRMTYGVQVVALVSASTSQGTVSAAFAQTVVHGALVGGGVGAAQSQPRL
jgi:triosephosphate isomerase